MFAKTIDCKICGFGADFFDSVDFSQNCMRLPVPPSGIQVPYYRCANCGFLFTNLCDQWTQAEFEQRIYNDQYIEVDPDFAGKRQLEQVDHLLMRIAPRKGAIRLLDYGGGSGIFARRMRERGFDTASYDPFHASEFAPAEDERFELLHCREVIEHASDPRAFVTDMARRMADESVAYMTTAMQPPDIAQTRLNWWYVGPRNGHISLFSQESLAMLWVEHGFQFGCYDQFSQIAWRGQPPCISCFL